MLNAEREREREREREMEHVVRREHVLCMELFPLASAVVVQALD
jgi:hypothetical protein